MTKISGYQGTALKRQSQLSNSSSALNSFNLPGNWAESLEEKFLHQLVRTDTLISIFVMLLFFLAMLMSMVTLASSSVEPYTKQYLGQKKVPVSMRSHLWHQLLEGALRKTIRMVRASLCPCSYQVEQSPTLLYLCIHPGKWAQVCRALVACGAKGQKNCLVEFSGIEEKRN